MSTKSISCSVKEDCVGFVLFSSLHLFISIAWLQQ